MKFIILVLFTLCSFDAICQENLSFRRFETILKKGKTFSGNDVITINNFSFVELANVDNFVIFLPVIIDHNLKNKDFGGYNSGGYVLIHDKQKNSYFEIRIDRRGINLEKKDDDIYEVGAILFYEFGDGYSIGIDITLITNGNKQYKFNLAERNDKLIINSRCIETKYCKVLTLENNLYNLDMIDFVNEIYKLDFESLLHDDYSYYFRKK
ncbi:hypothetical protein [Paenimyroides baculatum]|uniref:Uncharacterized protein n=1 Tax=Paenimyroides baculatum TaxID=2608000 RepID=A0A5M6CSM4_9FLAO|nr:hypothetical protein [Paenimyroides baculatum]KAA5538237.1 hypothetical protein F0460_01145 [Paenimyroides baculatum]